MARSKPNATDNAPKVDTFDRLASTEDQIGIANQIIAVTTPDDLTTIDPVVLLSDLRLAMDTFDLDRVAGPKSPWRHVEKQHFALQAAAKRFVIAIRNQDNALAVDEVLQQFGTDVPREQDGQQAEALIAAMNLHHVINYKPPKHGLPSGDATGRGTVEHLVCVDLQFLFQKHFKRKATSSLGTLVQPDTPFIRFVIAAFDAFGVKTTKDETYTANTIAKYMKPRQSRRQQSGWSG